VGPCYYSFREGETNPPPERSDMHKTIDSTPKLYRPAAAEEKVLKLNANTDDDWTYSVKHDPKGTGYSLIEVYDEEGEFVTYLTF